MTAAAGRQLLVGLPGTACPSGLVLAGFNTAEGLPGRGEAAGSGDGCQAWCQAPDAIG